MVETRFMRTAMLLGEEGLRRLQNSRVTVAGLGAVGGYALEALARAGIGHLQLIDFDAFDETNINRQILALESTVGRFKTEVAAERVHQINPACEVEICRTFINADTLPELLQTTPDYVVDAIDSLTAKCCLIEELWRRGIPFVSSMGAALKTDPASICFGRLSASKNCALARQVRQRLRRRGVNLDEVDCVFSTEQAILPTNALSAEAMPENGRHIMGSLPTITAIFGLTMANRVILKLAKQDVRS